LLAVTGTTFARLLELDDVPPDLPVGRGHDDVDGAGGGTAGFFEQRDDCAQERGIGVALRRFWFCCASGFHSY